MSRYLAGLAGVLLSLAGYQFADLMGSEHRAAYSFTRAAQARAVAESGIHYCAAALATPSSFRTSWARSAGARSAAFSKSLIPSTKPIAILSYCPANTSAG